MAKSNPYLYEVPSTTGLAMFVKQTSEEWEDFPSNLFYTHLMTTIWNQLSPEKTYEETASSVQGLNSQEVEKRLQQYGPNQLKEKARKSPWAMILDQFKDFMIIVLMVAAVIAGLTGEASDTIAIIVIVILNAIIGFVQEYRAEQAMAALKKMSAPNAAVIRNGNRLSIPADQLVPGDLVLMEAGDIVPADLRLTEVFNLKVEEAALTGESVPVEKHQHAIEKEDLVLGDRINMAYKGTTVTYGRAQGIVVGTGMETEIGHIAHMLQEEKELKTPLQRRLAAFGKKLAIIILLLCGIFFLAGIIRGEPVLHMLLTAISLAVAAIPEALPAVVTITLALGAKKLIKQQSLMRKLPAVETLGSVTYICSDKTGTLTINKMTVEEIYCPADNLKDDLLMALAISNDANFGEGGEIHGDPTEAALLAYGVEHTKSKEEWLKDYPRVGELPFDSDRKEMTTIHQHPHGGYISLTKGASEVLANNQELLDHANDMATRGLRTLTLARKYWDKLPENLNHDTLELDLEVLGVVGMMDPPRSEAKDAVALCQSAGIRPVMITGDHKSTAHAIASRLGIVESSDEKSVINSQELNQLSDDELKNRVEEIQVYARATPQQKLKIIKALQEKGQIVAMTGDGVNDAPALRRADIGVAMGITGSDVSKEAADMILLDDNFATIVGTVKEGRRIFDNIRKFIKYTMTSNSGELWTLFLAPLLGLPIPLLPIHILWINIVTDGLPGLALAAEEAEPNVMERKPRHPNETIFSGGLGLHIIWVGLLMGLVVIAMQFYGLKYHAEKWQTMVFTVLCLSQLGHVMTIRSDHLSFFNPGRILTNKALWGAVIFSVFLQLATIYIPVFNKVFHTTPLTLQELSLTLGFSLIVFIAVEVEKMFKKSY